MLIWAGIKKRLRIEIRVYAKEVLVAVGVLLVAAATETSLDVYPDLAFALWIPIIIGIVVIWVWLHRAHTRQGQVAPTVPLGRRVDGLRLAYSSHSCPGY